MNYIEYKLFHTFEYENKIRLGNNGDGGYVIGDLDCTYDCYISAGVSNEESFSRDFIEKYNMNETNSFAFDGTIENYPYEYTNKITYIKKNINNIENDHNTDLLWLINKYENIFLKMDIEGAEYNWLNLLDESHLNRFSQITMEFHGVCHDYCGCKFKALSKLAHTHYLIHAHGNNNGYSLGGIPDVIELTYINKKYFTEPPGFNRQILPCSLDFSNIPGKEDYFLGYYPFTCYLPHDGVLTNILQRPPPSTST
jgi:hypothetical protein